MLYKCENCRRQFEFDDFIEFCPYCGKMLDEITGMAQEHGQDNLVRTIDAIWGNKAYLKKEFSKVISQCVFLINDYSESCIDSILPEQSLSEYDSHYAVIRRSGNRKMLITEIDKFVAFLDCKIDNLSDCIPLDISDRLEKAVYEADDMIKTLYDFLGLKYTPISVDFFSEENYSAEILYTKEQLRDLFSLVMEAYVKYKRCVQDNNMYAAFSSKSDYGMLKSHYSKDFKRQADENDMSSKKTGEKADLLEKALKTMKEYNSQKYSGMLDEDFVPHVDAFWYGLQTLCEFIDNRISIKCATARFFIDNKEKARFDRIISSPDFEVNNVRLENAIDLKERFECKSEDLL